MLASTQLLLEQHFAGLAAIRKTRNNPVYALEHGLEPSTIAELRRTASIELQNVGLLDRDWLVWITLAAEAGYGYAGEEYWPALEHVPDEWRNNNNRTWLRRRFKRFSDKFGGPVPVGRWAEHFSIISWPIANAILPRYLQAHFARHLYDLRFELSEIANAQAERLGQVLLDRYDGASSRFSDFLQQIELTTQIVLALRDEDIGDSTARISPSLLARIVGDLEGRRESRDFLRAARKIISARRASVSPGLRPAIPGETAVAGGTPTIAGPRLAARVGDQEAILGLIFPDIIAALQRARVPQSALETARIQMAGSSQAFEPATGLLTFSGRDRQLDALPQAGKSIIALEGASSDLAQALTPLLSIPEQRGWVLRRQLDGLYREVVGGHVRTGQSYLILARSSFATDLSVRAALKPIPIRASGVVAYTLEIGGRLTEVQRVALTELGIGSISGIRVEPVGLAPSLAEQSSVPTWFSTEVTTLRVVADFEVGGFAIRIDGGPYTAMAAENGELLIALDELVLGQHQVTVQALARRSDLRSSTGETAAFDFLVTPPQPWREAMRSRAGFRMFSFPSTAKLEDILGGRAIIRISGPVARTVQWSLETYDAYGHLAATGDGGSTRIGAPDASVAAVMARLRQTHSEAIDHAHRVDIVASLGELGRQAIKFPHQVEPLRWVYDPSRRLARLIDETAHEAPVTVRRYDLATPLERHIIGAEAALAGLAIVPPGALLIADYRSKHYGVFASAPAMDRLTSLSDLGLSQSLAITKPDPEALLILIASLFRWRRARPLGPQAIVRQAITTARIDEELTIRACGRDFAAALALDEAKPFDRAQSMVGGSPGFGFRMRTFATPSNPMEGRDLLTDIARRYKIETDSELCAAAYSLAFEPISLRLGKGEIARAKAGSLLANRSLVRGAFLARTAARRGAIVSVAVAI
jgi:hypothetical protein